MFIAKGGFTAPYQTTCFGAGYTGLNNPPLSYESQGRVTARFGTAESCRESIWKMNRIQIP